MQDTKEKTLSNLRKDCKAQGIKVRKETLSWGPHVSFEINGIRIDNSSVVGPDFVERNRDKVTALKAIREEYKGLTIDGEKAYGI